MGMHHMTGRGGGELGHSCHGVDFLFAFSSRVRQQDSFKSATQDKYDLRAPITLLPTLTAFPSFFLIFHLSSCVLEQRRSPPRGSHALSFLPLTSRSSMHVYRTALLFTEEGVIIPSRQSRVYTFMLPLLLFSLGHSFINSAPSS